MAILGTTPKKLSPTRSSSVVGVWVRWPLSTPGRMMMMDWRLGMSLSRQCRCCSLRLWDTFLGPSLKLALRHGPRSLKASLTVKI